MRKEYDLPRLKVKRRDPLEGLHGAPEAPEVKTGQISQVTIDVGQRRSPVLRRKSDVSGCRFVH